MSSLPIELYRLIFQQLDFYCRSDLARLALTSRALRSEAERQLYANVHLLEVGASVRQSVQVKALTLLASTSRLSSHVRSLSFDTDPTIDHLLSLALRATVNLKRLHVNGLTYPRRISVLLAGVSFQLQSIWWCSRRRFDVEEAAALDMHTELTEFAWFSPPHLATIPKVPSAPKLKILILQGEAIEARHTLTQQTVTHYSQRLDSEDYVKGDVFESVRSLRISRHFQVRHAKHFPNLVYLSTTTVPDPNAVPLLKRLRKISICPNDSLPVPTWRRSKACSATLFTLSNSIQHVQVRGHNFAYEFFRGEDQSGDEPWAMDSDDEEWRDW